MIPKQNVQTGLQNGVVRNGFMKWCGSAPACHNVLDLHETSMIKKLVWHRRRPLWRRWRRPPLPDAKLFTKPFARKTFIPKRNVLYPIEKNMYQNETFHTKMCYKRFGYGTGVGPCGDGGADPPSRHRPSLRPPDLGVRVQGLG